MFFQFNLAHRGYFGKVLFDHNVQTLQLRVRLTSNFLGSSKSDA